MFFDRDPSQSEAMMQPHQARAFGAIVDDCASCHLGIDRNRGGQQLLVDDVSYPMHFVGWKCYYCLSKPSEEDLLQYKIVELTCSRAYEPQQCRHSRRITSAVGSSTKE